jgi:hypothetical protein
VDAHDHLEAVCHGIGRHLQKLAQGRCSGEISEKSFIETILKIEAEEVTPGGFILTASNTRDDWTVFKLRINGSDETCAAFEFLPESGEFRRVNSECDGEAQAN